MWPPRLETDLLLVFKDGPNHGLILSGEAVLTLLNISDNGYLPPIGHRGVMRPAWFQFGERESSPERVAAAWERIGQPDPPKVVYEVESTEDDIIVFAYKGEA